jgi:hypothetical protein
VLVAALERASSRLFGRAEDPGDDSAARRLAHLLRVAVPYPGPARDEYVLWLELWLRVLHEPALLPHCEAISMRWRRLFHEIVRRGAESGEFTPSAAPEEVAERLVAFVDGLGFETALGYRWTSPERMHDRLAGFAADQLGVERSALLEEAP